MSSLEASSQVGATTISFLLNPDPERKTGQCVKATGNGRRQYHLRDDRRLPERVPQEEVRDSAKGDDHPEGGQHVQRQGVSPYMTSALEVLRFRDWNRNRNRIFIIFHELMIPIPILAKIDFLTVLES